MFGSYTRLLSDFFLNRNELIKTNQNITSFLLANTSNFQKTDTYIISNNINTKYSWKNWGCFKILNTVSYNHQDSVSRNLMVGGVSGGNRKTALYISDYDKILKFSGNVEIKGDVYLPKARVEYAYMNGSSRNQIKIDGRKHDSETKLPEIDFPKFKNSDGKSTSLEILKDNSIYQPFNNKTLVISLDDGASLENITFKGNIILISDGLVEVQSSTNLADIILKARSVKIHKGFKGSFQIIAEDQVEIGSNVSLYYPSGILLNSKRDSSSVVIGASSKFAGNILLGGEELLNKNRIFFLEENAEIVGDIYCKGTSILKGKIYGRLFSDRIGVIGESGFSENVILNAKIDSDTIPRLFASGLIFKNESSTSRYEIIKVL